jgi:Flp pilus assembly protein TadD
MRKLSLLIVLLLSWSVSPTPAQVTSSQAREAEWKNYSLPQTNFVRQISPEKEFIFRIPADWKQEGVALSFEGPHSAQFKVYAQKIPDGYPLRDYFASFVRVVREQPGAAETMVTRRTRLQDLEARELLVEIPNPEGEMIRSTSWVAANGPLALTINLQVPVAHAAEVEPFLKAIVQSVIFLPAEHRTFEELRTTTLKTTAAGPVYEVENITSILNEVGVDREAAVARLTSLFSTNPDLAVDLLVDRRPLVRAAAVQALARSNNTALQPFVWEMIDDQEPLAAEAAARSVAASPDLIAQILKHSLSGKKIETIARIWPFMTKDKRTELLQKLFSKTAVPQPSPSPSSKTVTKTDVKVAIAEIAPVKPGSPVPDVSVGVSNDANVQIGALTLLTTITSEEFKLPLAQIMASNYDPLIALGLQVANHRGESLPLATLFKLVASSDQQVSKLAAENLGLSGSVSDISRIEALVSKDSATATAKKALDTELKLSIKKIQFRHDLAAAKNQNESRQIINKALSDQTMAGFAWRYDCEATIAGCGPTATFKSDFVVKPFGENLFPKKVRHYTAIPSLGQAAEKLYETLNGLQMDSPRAQANLVLILNNVRQKIGQQWSAPAEAERLTEYTGINLNAPIAFGSWTADKALESTGAAQRRAIVLRVKDRARFERLVDQFHEARGSFTNLTDYIAIGTRGIAALPAFLPLVAQAVIAQDPSKPKREPLQTYSLTSNKEWNGLNIKTFEHRRITFDWQMETSVTHLVYVGDYVVITSDLATIRELVTNANQSDRQSDHQTLADNTEFRKTVERRGDIVYFSDLKAIMADAAATTKDFNYPINESGALNIGNSTWENTHQLVFEESDWSKHLLPFHPKDLTAPRELLPASTIAYYLMKVDLASASSKSFGTFFLETSQTTSKVWAIDFQREVLPELGPECGAAILELPDFEEFTLGGTWATFCKLRTGKLADALNAGKLFNGIGPVKEFAEVKNGTDSYFFAARNGFLILSNSQKGLTAFDGKSNLAATRDYSRAVGKVPGGIVAFGGYNLEAAVASASKTPVEGLQGQVANAIFSIARAFHSQNFFATATRGSVEGRSSVAMDREGRYSFSDFSALTKGANITLAAVEPTGAPIIDQNRLSNLVLRVKAKTSGPIENIKDDIKTAAQTVEQKSPQELVLTVAARRAGTEKAVQLPVKEPGFAADLKATAEFPANDEQVKKQAGEIAGDDRDAWSVAQKLADWTHQNLEWKSIAHADAAQTLASREADCSEFSALFVAMARSLGLPARMVSGLAYGGDSFGGHAWVEVWAGRWIELDPTWGTHFVDATHIRDTSGGLVTSAALNLLELEVIEARRPVEDFQKSSKALAQHLLKAIPSGNKSEIEAVVEIATLTDEFMGAGAWAKMTEAERNQMWSAYRTVVIAIIEYSKLRSEKNTMHLIHLEEKGDVAEATCLLSASEMLIKLRLVRQNGLWYLAEIRQNDADFHTVAESIRPVITSIENARAGKRVAIRPTDFLRVLLLVRSEPAKALAVAEEALKAKPADRSLRLLKTFALSHLEEKADEATKLLRELSKEDFAPAVYRLASYLDSSEDENEKKEALALYEKYVLLEPYDPRGFHELAGAYDNIDDFAKAEAAYRKVVELNPNDPGGYLDLATFLVFQDRLPEAGPTLVAADKNVGSDEDVFGGVMRFLVSADESSYAIKFAASEPERMKKSAAANLALGRMHLDNGQYPSALPLLQTAAQLDKDWDEPHIGLAQLYRKQSRWTAALKAAEHAIALDDEDGESQYERACALARLGRINEAMAALEKAIELYPDQAEWMNDEKDLKALAKLPAFKKLLPKPEKQ